MKSMNEITYNIIKTKPKDNLSYEYVVLYDTIDGINGYKPFFIARRMIMNDRSYDYIEAGDFKGRRYKTVIGAENDIKAMLLENGINYKIKKGVNYD